jgi:hypothetical protein
MAQQQTRLVSVESPFNAVWPWQLWRNVQYAILCNAHAASLGDATYVSHLCNTQYVAYGINGYASDTLAALLRGHAHTGSSKYYTDRWTALGRTRNVLQQRRMDAVVCYTDYGVSSGMREAVGAAEAAGVPVEYRQLPGDLKRHVFGESLASTAVPVLKTGLVTGFAVYGLVKFIVRR